MKFKIPKSISFFYIIYTLGIAIIDYFKIFDASIFFRWMSFSIILMYFHLGYNHYGSKAGLKNLLNQVYWASILYIIYFIIVQFISFDSEIYSTYSGLFQLGAIRNKRIYVLSLFSILLLFTLIHQSIIKKNRIITFLIILILISIIVATFRRTAWISLFLGALVLVSRINFKKMLSLMTFVGFSLYLVYLKFSDIIVVQNEARGNVLEVGDKIANDYRILEYIYIFLDMSNNSITWVLFGDKNRWSESVFWLEHAGVDNAIHSDIVALIFSNGLFGLFIYLLIYCRMFIKVRMFKIVNGSNNSKLGYKTLFYALFIMNFVVLFSGGVYRVPINGIISFLFLGSLTRLITSDFKRQV